MFVADPVKIKIEGAPELNVELDLHPDNKKGGRSFVTSNEFFISQQDFDNIKEGKLVRLIDCLTFKKDGKLFKFVSKDYETYKESGKLKGPIINWVVDDNKVNVELKLPDASVVLGFGEKWINDVKENQIIQFERFGFVRCDSVENDKTVFWFGHK